MAEKGDASLFSKESVLKAILSFNYKYGNYVFFCYYVKSVIPERIQKKFQVN
jgi:hypothetical protein